MAKKRRNDDYDDYGWGYFPPASKPIKTTEGIKSKSKRGAFGQSWWAKRWIQVLESFDIGARLQRGRSYARGGQVLNIDIGPGLVESKVQGSQRQPYKVTIKLPQLSEADWEKAIDAMSQQAIFAAKLLAGEMPNEIEDAFKSANLSLFPSKGDQLVTACSCPDYSNPCKHIAAVYYLLGEQFDADPFLIFVLRGRTKDQIIEALRARRAAAVASEGEGESESISEEAAPALDTLLETFWRPGDLEALSVRVAGPELQLATLRRLGASPAGTHEPVAAIYKQMTETALKKVYGSE